MTDFQALTYIKLNDVVKNPGETISKAELEAADQDQDDIDRLLADGALGYEGDPLHPDHQTDDDSETPSNTENAVSDSENGGEK